MKTLTVTLADVEGLPHGSTRSHVTVSARYSGEVVLTDGTIIPSAIREKSLSTGGVVEFDVYASDDPDVAPEYHGFAIIVTASVEVLRGQGKGARVQRTVKVLTSHTSPVVLGSLEPAEGLQPGFMTVSELNADIDARLDALESAPAGGGGGSLTPVSSGAVVALPADADVGDLYGYSLAGAATVNDVALAAGDYVFRKTATGWDYRRLADATPLVATPDTTAPTAGTLASSAITDTGFTLTASGASDNKALHSSPYAFSLDGGTTWSAWQTSAVYVVTGRTASTAYQARHKVRDAAGNVSTGTTITVTTIAAPTTTTYSESFNRTDGTNLVGLLTEVGGTEMHDSAFWTTGLESGNMAPVVNGGRLDGVADQGPRCAIAPTVAAGQVLTHSIDYDLTSGAGDRQVRIKVGPLGDAFAMFYVTATGEVKNSSNETVHSGAPLAGRIGIRANGTSRELLINGTTVHTATVAAALVGAEQFCAFAVYGSGASVDNWEVVIGT